MKNENPIRMKTLYESTYWSAEGQQRHRIVGTKTVCGLKIKSSYWNSITSGTIVTCRKCLKYGENK